MNQMHEKFTNERSSEIKDLLDSNHLPLVSIGMPVYNGAKYIRQALDSLLAQDYAHFELIISDNASTDDTAVICKEFATRDARISYHCNEQNMGPAWNFTRVLEMSAGEYFMWAAHDDEWLPNHISTIVPMLESNKKVVLAVSGWYCVNIDGEIMTTMLPPLSTVSRSRRKTFINYLLQPHWEVEKACFMYGLMRRDVLLSLNISDIFAAVDITIGNDVALVLALIATGPVAYTSERTWRKRYTYPRILPNRVQKYRRAVRSIKDFLRGRNKREFQKRWEFHRYIAGIINRCFFYDPIMHAVNLYHTLRLFMYR